MLIYSFLNFKQFVAKASNLTGEKEVQSFVTKSSWNSKWDNKYLYMCQLCFSPQHLLLLIVFEMFL